MGEPYDAEAEAEAEALVAGQCNCGRPDGRLGWGSKHNDRCPAYHLEDNEDEIAAALRRAYDAGRRERDAVGEPYDAEAEAERYWAELDERICGEVPDLADFFRRAYDAGREAGRCERDDALRALESYDAEAVAERYWDAFDDVPGHEVLDLSVWFRRAHDTGRDAGRRERDDALRALVRSWRARSWRSKTVALTCAEELLDLLDREGT